MTAVGVDLRSDIIMLIPMGLQLLGISFAVLIDPYVTKKRKRIMFGIILLMAVLIAMDIVSTVLTEMAASPSVILERKLQSIFCYSARPVVLLLFIHLVRPERKHWALFGLTAACALLYLTALFTPLTFGFHADNVFFRGPLGYTSHVVCGVLLICLLAVSLREYGSLRRAEALIPAFNALLLAAAAVVDTFILQTRNGITVVSITAVSSTVFFYVWLHLLFVREHTEELQAEQRARLLLSQIRPHFLYNTLATIQSLCRIEPERAADVTGKFSTYLRQNLEAMGETQLIPFAKELEHTRAYAGIEEIRFPNLRVEYDTPDTEFLLPPLTVQPLVENAIRHGVRERKQGLVTVSARLGEGCHEIVIRDNGKGFDAGIIDRADGSHIGVRNVRERLERLCNGTMTIESVPGEGTAITLRIPR